VPVLRAKLVTIVLWPVSAVLWSLAVIATVDLGGRAAVLELGLSLVPAAASFVAGYLVIRHDPANWVGTWLTAAGANVALQMAHGTWQEALAEPPTSLPGSALLLVLTQGVWMGWFVPFAMVLVLFPDGRPRGRLGWGTAIALCVIPVAFNLLLSIQPGALMPPLDDWPRPLGTHWVGYGALVILPVFLATLVTAARSVAHRHREAATDVERSQLRWMMLAAAGVPGTLVLCWIGYLVVGGPAPVAAGLVFINVAIPAATLIAMLRHDLYEVDRAIVQAWAYGILTAGALAVYAGTAALVGRGLGEDSTTAAVTATAVVMLLLRPAHRRLVRVLAGRFHPRETAGLAAIADLTAGVHAGERSPEDLEAALREALRDGSLTVGYRRRGTGDYTDRAGNAVAPSGGDLVTVHGDPVAVIVSGSGRPVPARVVAAAGLLADSVGLRAEIAESHRRIAEAEREERRRLEMDLHDGAQQRLVALGMRLRVLQRRARNGTEVDLDRLVDGAVADITDAVGELRAISHGVRPSRLGNGLGDALRELGRACPIPVAVHVDDGELPEPVRVAAYFVATEGVTNALKHAAANRVDIAVTRTTDGIRIAVGDDGRGGARLTPGSGLSRLTERLREIDGGLAITSEAGRGTTLVAEIPCAS